MYNYTSIPGGVWKVLDASRSQDDHEKYRISDEARKTWKEKMDEFERKQREASNKTAEQERLERASAGIGNIYKGDL